MSDIEVERKGEVEWIRLNRPERMNAYDAEMARELIEAVENASGAGRDCSYRDRPGLLRRWLPG